MSEGPLELDLGDGVLSFDGRIVEAFGFNIGDNDSRRAHVSMIEGMELNEGRWDLIEVHGRGGFSVTLKLDDSRRAELEQFMQVVREAGAGRGGSG